MVMKDLKNLSLCLPMALLALSGCSNDDETVNGALLSERTIVATIENQADTRMTINATDNSLSWSATDVFMVFDETGTKSNTYVTDETSAAGGMFSLKAEDTPLESKKYAFYPSLTENVLGYTNSTLKMTLPAAIDATGKELPCNLPMFGNIAENKISFTFMTGLLKLDLNNLPKNTKQIIVTADKQIAGEFTKEVSGNPANLELAVDSEATETDAKKNTVTVTIATADAEADFNKVVYVPLPTGNYGSITVKFSDGATPNPTVTELCKLTGKTVARAKVYKVARTYSISSDATTPEDINTDIKSDLESIKSGDVVEVQLSSAITGSSTDAIEVPQVNETTVALNLATVPTTTATEPLTIASGTATETGAAVNNVEIVQAPTEDGSYLNIQAPTTTATLKAKEGETTKFEQITAHTAVNTLVIDKNVTVEKLIVKGGNVKVLGTLTGIDNQTDGIIYVVLGEGVQKPTTENGDNIVYITEAEAELRAAAQLGTDYTLTGKISLSAPLVVEKAWNLYLADGAELSNNTTDYAKVLNTQDGLVLVRCGATLTIDYAAGATAKTGTIKATELNNAIKLTDSNDASLTGVATLNVQGGNIESTYFAIAGNGNRDYAVFNISGGTLTSEKDYAIFLPQACSETVNTISGGTITGGAGAVGMRDGKLTISGDAKLVSKGNGNTGKFADGTGNFANAVINVGNGAEAIYGNCTVTIQGGTFTAEGDATAIAVISKADNKTSYTATISVEGGEFSDPSAMPYMTATTSTASVVLQQDLVVSSPIVVMGKATLDLNGKTLSAVSEGWTASPYASSTSGLIMVRRGGHLTIEGKGENSIIDALNVPASAIFMIDGNDANDTANKATLVVNGGIIRGNRAAIYGNGNRHGTDITINGGELSGNYENSNGGIYHPQNGTLTITGGTVTGLLYGVEMRAGTLNISGGTVKATTGTFKAEPNNSGSTITGAAVAASQHTTEQELSVTVSGGILEGVMALYEADLQEEPTNVTLSVTGGTFIGGVYSEHETAFIKGGEFNDPYAINYVAAGTSETEKSVVTVTLPENGNIEVNQPLLLDDAFAEVTVNLNGATILNKTPDQASTPSVDLFVVSNGVLNIKGEGKAQVINATEQNNYLEAVWAHGTGVVNIYGGEFYSSQSYKDHADLIYAKDNSTINIYGGTFKSDAVDADGNRWLLNLKDGHNCNIYVSKGVFYGFNPQVNNTENPQRNYCVEGATVTESDGDGIKIYTVTPPASSSN